MVLKREIKPEDMSKKSELQWLGYTESQNQICRDGLCRCEVLGDKGSKSKKVHMNSLGETLPPETGASMNTAPIFSAATAISLETAGSIVEESISSVPFFTFLQRARRRSIKTSCTAHKVSFVLFWH